MQDIEKRFQKELDELRELEKKEKVKKNNNLKSNLNKIEYKRRKKRIRLSFTKVFLMSMLLIFSTYAWFTTQKDITISNLRGTVEVAENMELSLDAKVWSQKIDLTEAKTEFQKAQTSRLKGLKESASDPDDGYIIRSAAILPKELLPVSTVGEKNQTESFTVSGTTYNYGVIPFYSGKATSTKLTQIGKCLEYNDDESEMADNGYYAFDIYIKNTSRDGEDDILQLNLNSAAQVLTSSIMKTIVDEDGNTINRTYTGNEDSGLQNTIRVALALYGGTDDVVSATATQKEILEASKDGAVTDIAIWEPNAKDHVEYIVNNNNKLTDGSGTKTDEELKFESGEEVDTYALKSNSIGATIENIYDINTSTLGKQVTFKTSNIKDETTGEVTSYRIKTTDDKPLDIKNIDNQDFKIGSNKISRLRVYVWIEGQDVDCINQASYGGGIEVDLGLTKDDFVGDVLEDNKLNLNVEYEVTAESDIKVTVRAEKELQLPTGWSYEEVEEPAIGQVYRLASTEGVKVAATTINKKAICKTFSGGAAANIEISALDGSKNILQFEIVNPSGGTPCMMVTKYDKIEETTGNVTVTITSDKVLTAPTGWGYANPEKTAISKVYTENITENVEVTDENGNRITVEVKVDNIVELGQVPEEPTEPPAIAEVTNNNIGDYIDLGNNVVGTTSTEDDWRILYVDEAENKIYAILADYLPASQMPAATKLETFAFDAQPMYRNYGFSLYSPDYSWNNNKDWWYAPGVLEYLNTVSNWSELANGINGAVVKGSPSAELLINSYNKKNNDNFNYLNTPQLASNTDKYNLYVPKTSDVIDLKYGFTVDDIYTYGEDKEYSNVYGTYYCLGYVLATNSDETHSYVMNTNGKIDVWDGGTFVGGHGDRYALRPVVELPINVGLSKEGNIWKVTENNQGGSGGSQEPTDTTLPVWSYIETEIIQPNESVPTATVKVKFKGTDENYKTNILTKDIINVSVDSTPITSKTLSLGTSIGNGVEYILTLTGIENSGNLSITIPANTLEDQAGNKNVSKTISKNLIIYKYGETLASKIIGNEATEYGAYVNYPVDIDDYNGDGIGDNITDNDWRIFNVDESTNTVYLIADSYVPMNLADPTETTSTYIYTKVYSGGYTYLQDTSNWTSMVDSNYAQRAIGSPTIELWADSWNTLYPNDKLYYSVIEYEYSEDIGYCVGKEENPTDPYTGAGFENTTSNTVYSSLSVQNGDCYGYFLASPLAFSNSSGSLWFFNGYFSNYEPGDSAYFGIRPIVTLNEGINATKLNGVWHLENKSEETLRASASYNTTDLTTENIIATITANKEIQLPSGWEYVNSEKKSVQKTYTTNTTENITITDTTENSITVPIKIFNISVSNGTTGVLADVIEGKEYTEYGLYTNYSVNIDSIADDNDWQIFYSDDSNDVYLIADDYIPISKVKEGIVTVSTTEGYTKYGISIDSQGNLSEALSNQENWDNFKDANGKGIEVTGVPTAEMFMGSWNKKFAENNIYNKIQYDNGCYEIRPDIDKFTYTGGMPDIKSFDTDLARMYFPHPYVYQNVDDSRDGNSNCYGYLLTSETNLQPLFYVVYYGSILSTNSYTSYYTNEPYGLRPVVKLKNGITATKVNGIWELGN